MNVKKMLSEWEWRLTLLSLLVLLFVASIFVILEAKFHAFALIDEAALNALRISGVFVHPGLNPEAAAADKVNCPAGTGRYAVVLLPAALGPEAAGNSSSPHPLWLETVRTLRDARAKTVALDVDVWDSGTPAEVLLTALRPKPGELGQSPTSLAMIALPVFEVGESGAAHRRKRNTYLAAMCDRKSGVSVAVASPNISHSLFSNTAVQFHWQRVVGDEVAGPLAYPALGQVTRLLVGGRAAEDALAAGALCSYLAKADPDGRLPFVEAPDRQDLAEMSEPGFQAQLRANQIFSIDWLNPHGVARDIPVLNVRSPDDLSRLAQSAGACIRNRAVFVGRWPSPSGVDKFSTAIGNATPGTVVHAMAARSTEIGLRGALAVNAAVDLLAGYLLTALVPRKWSLRLGQSESFALRLLSRLGHFVGPIAASLAVCVVAVLALNVGLLLNPLVVFLGIWLHVLLDSFLHDEKLETTLANAAFGQQAYNAPPTASDRKEALMRWLDRLPRPRMAAAGRLRVLDACVYGGSICIVIGTITYAAILVAFRLQLNAL